MFLKPSLRTPFQAPALTFGAQYKLDSATTLKGKAQTNGNIGLALATQLTPQVSSVAFFLCSVVVVTRVVVGGVVVVVVVVVARAAVAVIVVVVG